MHPQCGRLPDVTMSGAAAPATLSFLPRIGASATASSHPARAPEAHARGEASPTAPQRA